MRDSHAPCPVCTAPPAAECYAWCLKMRAAYDRERRPSWPATYSEAMADPIVRREIDIYARRIPAINRRPTIVPPEPIATSDPEGHRQAMADAEVIPAPRFLDQKSRAAGEREDDD